MTVRIVVDAMGGDEDPKVVLEGIALALQADSDLEIIVAGAEDVVVPFCAKHARCEALVTTQTIEMADHPVEAVRKKKDSSIVRGCRAVKDGSAQGFFSAGSTGAILAAGTLVVGRAKGVSRAVITSALPSSVPGHMTTLLDLGGSTDPTVEMMAQFAQMGSAYSEVVIGTSKPTVALLSNGTEDTKGSDFAKEVFAKLQATPNIDFVGNCEGRDILCGTYDVIVTDGFTGNVALKTLEGTAKYIVAQLKAAASASKKVGLGALMVKPALKDMSALLSGDLYGGAIMLGLKAPVLVGHGATNPEAIKNGALTTARCVRLGLCDKLAAAIAQEG